MKKRNKWRRSIKWWFVFRVEQRNPTWKFNGHAVLVDAVRAYTEIEALLHGIDRNPVRRWQSMHVRQCDPEQYNMALEVRAGRNKQVRELRETLNV